MTLQCAICERCWETWEEGALFLTECYPKHVGDPPEIFHFCQYKCLKEWVS